MDDNEGCTNQGEKLTSAYEDAHNEIEITTPISSVLDCSEANQVRLREMMRVM